MRSGREVINQRFRESSRWVADGGACPVGGRGTPCQVAVPIQRSRRHFPAGTGSNRNPISPVRRGPGQGSPAAALPCALLWPQRGAGGPVVSGVWDLLWGRHRRTPGGHKHHQTFKNSQRSETFLTPGSRESGSRVTPHGGCRVGHVGQAMEAAEWVMGDMPWRLLSGSWVTCHRGCRLGHVGQAMEAAEWVTWETPLRLQKWKARDHPQRSVHGCADQLSSRVTGRLSRSL